MTSCLLTRRVVSGSFPLCIDFILADLTATQIRLIDIALPFYKNPAAVENLIVAQPSVPLGNPLDLEIPFLESDGSVNNVPVVACN